MRADRVIVCFLAAVALAGCASRPINEPIAQVDPKAGYRPYLLLPKRQNNDPQTLFVLSFSGGGTRAAAFSYGVLEELRRTEIVVDGKRRRLIDEVDMITGVSGGSFTALAYALYGERLFAEYEQRFLKRDVEGTLLARSLNPFNWWKFIGGSAGRSELAADYYDEILFEGATFGDLLDKQGPLAIATGTDISTGSRLAFFQNDFDLLCSDLNKVRLVARGRHVLGGPGGAVGGDVQQLRRHLRLPVSGLGEGRRETREPSPAGGTRAAALPRDAGIPEQQGSPVHPPGRRRRRGQHRRARRPGGARGARGERDVPRGDRFRRHPQDRADRRERPLGPAHRLGPQRGAARLVAQLLQASGVPIDRYSFETVELMKDRAEIVKWRRELLVARKRLAGASEAQAEASVPKISLEVLDVSFDAIRDPKERAYFMNLPTSFVLPPEEVDRLREVAGRLLRQSAEYESVVREFGGTPARSTDGG